MGGVNRDVEILACIINYNIGIRIGKGCKRSTRVGWVTPKHGKHGGVGAEFMEEERESTKLSQVTLKKGKAWQDGNRVYGGEEEYQTEPGHPEKGKNMVGWGQFMEERESTRLSQVTLKQGNTWRDGGIMEG